ncbi:hypothetical protein BACOVA_01416 [Bacteroides ovatus ATCC 8483]|uniref:Uncharacterized protein n=1 Tax=Bacteroides ovatus (strain ATCC 8483 / DSM 1896 / JCM 5824 / BCRC 10623 / CCUG 4943 / NCTC 11153) TaxID=411476 RepID=A0AAN3AA88_BACO1|nr:hypothetical protein BACOVA_01416 [Bacteroides ovatus ATCC 8483]
MFPCFFLFVYFCLRNRLQTVVIYSSIKKERKTVCH